MFKYYKNDEEFEQDKAIEEMAKIIDDRISLANNYLGSMNKGMGYWIAEELIKHYQHNIPQNALILIREEDQRLFLAYQETLEGTRKEITDKFAKMLKVEFAGDIERCGVVDKTLKKIMEGVDNGK
jgi:hypothetical protein